MLKRIFVPEGKKLRDKTGIYTYVGPREVKHTNKLRLEPTFTDGTPWEYISETSTEEIKEVALEEEVAPEEKKVKISEENISEEVKDVSDEPLSSEKERVKPSRPKTRKTQRKTPKRSED